MTLLFASILTSLGLLIWSNPQPVPMRAAQAGRKGARRG